MYNKTTIKNLYNVCGWRQSPLAAYAIVDSVNQESLTGLYYQDFHPLVNIENIYNIAPEGLSDADFNTWLNNLTKSAVIKVINGLLQRQRPKSRDLLEHARLFNFENRMEAGELITNTGAFVGYEIQLYPANHLKLTLDAIGIMINATQSVPIYVFHSHYSDPIKSITSAISGYSGGEKWTELTSTNAVDLYNYYGSSYSGGKFYMGYRQEDLGNNQAYDREYDMSSIQHLTKYFDIRPFKVDGYTGTSRFDVDSVEYTSETWGLNFEFTTHVDLTRFFDVHKTTIANLIGLQVAVDTLQMIANSTRTNALKQEIRDRADQELNMQDIGLIVRLQKEMDAVDLDISGLDPIALPDKPGKLKSYTLL